VSRRRIVHLSREDPGAEVEVEDVIPKLPQRRDGLPEEGRFAATLRAKYYNRPPRALPGPVFNPPKGAVPICELDPSPGRRL